MHITACELRVACSLVLCHGALVHLDGPGSMVTRKCPPYNLSALTLVYWRPRLRTLFSDSASSLAVLLLMHARCQESKLWHVPSPIGPTRRGEKCECISNPEEIECGCSGGWWLVARELGAGGWVGSWSLTGGRGAVRSAEVCHPRRVVGVVSMCACFAGVGPSMVYAALGGLDGMRVCIAMVLIQALGKASYK